MVGFFCGYVEHVNRGFASEDAEDLPLQTKFLRLLNQPSQVADFHSLQQRRSHAHLGRLYLGSIDDPTGACQQVDFRTNKLIVLVDLFQEVILFAQKLYFGPNVMVDVVKEHMRGLPLLHYSVTVVPSSISSSWVRVITLGGRTDPGIHPLEEPLHGAGLLDFHSESLAESLELPITQRLEQLKVTVELGFTPME